MWPADLHRFETVESTNATAAAMAVEGAPSGTVVLAATQTAGRGRMQRRWQSPAGGLWFSVIFQQVKLDGFHAFQLIAAASICEAVEDATGVRVEIRWPNDMMLDGAKVGGILTEIVEAPQGHAAVMGIGLNTNVDAIALQALVDEGRVASLSGALGRKVDAEDLLTRIARRLESNYGLFLSGERVRLLEAVRGRDMLQGREVTVSLGNETLQGDCIGIREDGALDIRTADGPRTLYAGAVRLLRPVDKGGRAS